MAEKDHVLLVDVYSLVYRAFFALPPLTTSSGKPVNAAFGFGRMLPRMLREEKPSHVIACFDAKYSCTLSDDNAGDPVTAANKVLAGVVSAAKDHPGIDSLVDHKTVHSTSGLTGKTATTFNNNTVLTVLSEIASKANAELLVVDGKVRGHGRPP